MNLKRTVLFVICVVLCHSKVSDDGICNRTEKKEEYRQVTVSKTVVFCCLGYEKKTDETCQKCLPGFTSNGTKCERCPEGHYGGKCTAECNCTSNERCDHVKGCVAKPNTDVIITHKPECLPGFTLNGTKCEQCPEGRYGEKCSAKCNCDSNERCDHVTGCVPISSTEVNIAHTSDEDLSDKKQLSGTGIGIYLICIVVVLLLVIIFVIVWQS